MDLFRRIRRSGLALIRPRRTLSLASLSSAVEDVVARLARSVVGLESDDGRPLGAATVVTRRGLVVTAAHVVSRRRQVRAILPDGRRVSGRVCGGGGGADLFAELALLSIDSAAAGPLEPAPFDFTASPRIGEIVVAIGAPGGQGCLAPCSMKMNMAPWNKVPDTLAPRAALGIVSGVGAGPFAHFVTDVRAIPGATGGPLAGADGRVVGIACFGASSPDCPCGGGAGIAASQVAAALARLRSSATPARALGLGGWGQILDAEAASRLRVEGRCGVLVIDVARGGAACSAGLLPLDVIVRANGRRVESLDALSLVIERAAARGAPLDFEAIRGDRLVRVRVDVEWTEEEAGAAQ